MTEIKTQVEYCRVELGQYIENIADINIIGIVSYRRFEYRFFQYIVSYR